MCAPSPLTWPTGWCPLWTRRFSSHAPMTPRTSARSRAGRSTTRWLVVGNAALLGLAAVLLALLLAQPPTQPEADTANALGAQALDHVEDYTADAPPGSMASLRD